MEPYKGIIRRFGLLLLFPIILLNCWKEPGRELLLFDFESDAELDQLSWHCHALNSLSAQHCTHGSKSLKLELYPSDYPGLDLMPREHDWREYKELRFDVYNPQVTNVQLSVRIDDRNDSPGYDDRYNKSFVLNPGMNHMNIPFSTLVRSGTGKPLSRKSICRFLVFVVRPKNKVDLYLDNIRLTSDAASDQWQKGSNFSQSLMFPCA